MKVLQINSVCGVGSTGRIMTDIDSKLRENNIESYIAYGRRTSIQNHNTLKIGSKLDYCRHGILTRIFDNHGLSGSEKATYKFIDQIDKIHPDVIHLHNLHGYYINVKILFDYLKVIGKPVVWTLHDCWSFTGHCTYFSYAKCEKWIEECHKCPQKGMYPKSIIVDNSQRNYQVKKQLFTSLENLTIVTPSKWLADLVEKSFLSNNTIKIIPNGIDIDVFKPIAGEAVREKFKLRNKFIILGVAGLWEKRKGLSHFIELSKMITDDCRIVLVGLDEKQTVQLPANIIGINKTSNIHELAQMYSAADVFVNPSVEETFGLVTAEALACGTPAIVFDSTPGVEIVNTSCGYIAKIGNIYEIKKFIDVIRNQGKEYYSQNCVRRAVEKFAKNDRLDEYIELYKR